MTIAINICKTLNTVASELLTQQLINDIILSPGESVKAQYDGIMENVTYTFRDNSYIVIDSVKRILHGSRHADLESYDDQAYSHQ